MFAALGRLTYRRRRWVLALGALFVVFAATWGTQVFGSLQNGGFDDPDSESARAAVRAEQAVGRGDADLVVLYSSPDLTVDDPAFRRAVERTLADLPSEDVTGASTYWSTRSDLLVSDDRHATYAALQLDGATDQARTDTYADVRDRLDAPGLDTKVGGQAAVFSAVNDQVSEDIARAESLSLPLVMVLLVVVFGSLAAASLPLAVGGLAILGAFTALRLLTLATDVSVFAVNIVTMLGLGLAIDYALFVVSRFREEMRRTDSVEHALVTTMSTAGRTVAFSGLTVAISLAGLLLFPQVFLRSMGFGGMAAVVVAMVGALTVLPALLAVLGPRVDSLRLPWRRRRATAEAGAHAADGGAWARVARSVMRRPVAYAAVIVALLVAVGLPFLRVQFGGVDARVLPDGTESRVVAETLDRDFAPNATTPVEVVVTGADRAGLSAYADRLGDVPGVTGVQVTASQDDAATLAVRYDADPQSSEARALVEDVREVPAPDGAESLVGGQTAELVDLLASLGGTLPWMALFVGVVTLVLLFLAFGSVVLPLKALVMNVLSLTAAFGAVVWIFQDGHLSGLLGFTSTGTVEATQPILMLAIAFGLSMDYEVFLLSRVREQWDATHDNTTAVATGLQRTGRIITSAALLLVVVIGAFSTSGITFIKMIGVGLAIAIVVDATVVRALLVPATMRLLGRANWWAPGPLRRLWERYGVREGETLPGDGVTEPVPEGIAAAGSAPPGRS